MNDLFKYFLCFKHLTRYNWPWLRVRHILWKLLDSLFKLTWCLTDFKSLNKSIRSWIKHFSICRVITREVIPVLDHVVHHIKVYFGITVSRLTAEWNEYVVSFIFLITLIYRFVNQPTESLHPLVCIEIVFVSFLVPEYWTIWVLIQIVFLKSLGPTVSFCCWI